MTALQEKAKEWDQIAINMEANTEDGLRKAEINNIRAVLVLLIELGGKEEALINSIRKLVDMIINPDHAGNHEQFRK